MVSMVRNAPGVRPCVLAIFPGLIPSTFLYIVKPLGALHRAKQIDFDFALEYAVSRRSLEWADIFVFCRNTEPANNYLLDYALSHGKPVVYDLDDNFFDISPTTEVGRYYRRPECIEQLRCYLKHATLVRVYSEALRERVAPLNSNTVRVVGPVDWSLIPGAIPQMDQHRVRIVYATGRFGEDPLSCLFLNDLQELLKTYQNRIEIVFWGNGPRELHKHPAVRFLAPIVNYDRFFYKFARSGFDIGLAPLKSDSFHRSKSNVKFREYGACGIAGVYSNVGPYAEVVKNRVTGLLVENKPGDWYAAISQLIEDENLRYSIQNSARDYARNWYTLELFQEVWLTQIRMLAMQRTRRCESLPLMTSDLTSSTQVREAWNSLFISQGDVVSQAMRYCYGRIRKIFPSVRRRGILPTITIAWRALKELMLLFKLKAQLRGWLLGILN